LGWLTFDLPACGGCHLAILQGKNKQTFRGHHHLHEQFALDSIDSIDIMTVTTQLVHGNELDSKFGA